MARRFDPQFAFWGNDEEEPKDVHRPPTIDIIKALTPTALVVVGYFSRNRPSAFYGLAVLAVLGTFYDPIVHRIHLLRDKVHNKRIAKGNLRQLRTFSEELGNFLDVSGNRLDTLQGLMDYIRTRFPTASYRVPIPAVEIFHNQWHYLNRRIQAENFTPNQFHPAAHELWNVISGYSVHSVFRAFETFVDMSKDFQFKEKSQFNAFQQNWVLFANSYIKFLKHLNEDFRGFEALPISVTLPLPLS